MSTPEILRLIKEMQQHPHLADNRWDATVGPKTVWHYTSFKNLTEIIPDVGSTDRFIRAAPLTEMNDRKDGRWLGTNVARKLIEPAERYLRMAVKTEPVDVFVACFSDDKDRLSQWWRYADQGHGVAFGFSVPDLHAAATKVIGSPPDFYKVRYVKRGDPLFQLLVPNIRKLNQLVYELPDELSGTKRGFNYGLRTMLRVFEPGVKNKAFKEEHEYRIVFQSPSPSGYRLDRGNLIPYLNVPIEASVTKIMLGPLCTARKNHFQAFIEKRLGYPIEVKRSRATLRA